MYAWCLGMDRACHWVMLIVFEICYNTYTDSEQDKAVKGNNEYKKKKKIDTALSQLAKFKKIRVELSLKQFCTQTR